MYLLFHVFARDFVFDKSLSNCYGQKLGGLDVVFASPSKGFRKVSFSLRLANMELVMEGKNSGHLFFFLGRERMFTLASSWQGIAGPPEDSTANRQ